MDSMVERCGQAIQAAWDSGDHPAVNLPPIEFTKVEREYLARAVNNVAIPAVVAAIEGERLVDYTGEPTDNAYNQALDDILKAVCALSDTEGR